MNNSKKKLELATTDNHKKYSELATIVLSIASIIISIIALLISGKQTNIMKIENLPIIAVEASNNTINEETAEYQQYIKIMNEGNTVVDFDYKLTSFLSVDFEMDNKTYLAFIETVGDIYDEIPTRTGKGTLVELRSNSSDIVYNLWINSIYLDDKIKDGVVKKGYLLEVTYRDIYKDSHSGCYIIDAYTSKPLNYEDEMQIRNNMSQFNKVSYLSVTSEELVDNIIQNIPK